MTRSPLVNGSTGQSPGAAEIGRPEWLDATAWPFPVRQVPTPSGPVSVTDVGTGTPILFVHTGFWSFVWRDVLLALPDGYRGVTLDAPGTGASSRPAGSGITLEHASAAIGAVMDHIDEPFTLVVHDLGGPAGLRAAADRPDQINGLVIVNAFGWQPSGFAFRTMLATMGSAPMREFDAWTGMLPRASSTKLGVGRHFTRADRKVFRSGIDRQARRSFHRYMRSARKSRDLFVAIETAVAGPLAAKPVLTIFGEKNDPLGFQPKWKERFPAARQLVIPDGMHFPMCDDPQFVTTALTRWHREQIG